MDWVQCLETGRARRKSSDKELAKSLVKIAGLRFKEHDKKVTSDNASLIIEGLYESVLEIIHALLSIEGLKTETHECAILFLKEFYDFTPHKIDFLDRVRRLRNSIKYEGLIVDKSRAEKIIEQEKETYYELKAIAETNLQN